MVSRLEKGFGLITEILERDALRKRGEKYLDSGILKKFSAISEDVLTEAENVKYAQKMDYKSIIDNLEKVGKFERAFELLYKHFRLNLLGRDNKLTLQ